jgi:hypothetical protein
VTGLDQAETVFVGSRQSTEEKTGGVRERPNKKSKKIKKSVDEARERKNANSFGTHLPLVVDMKAQRKVWTRSRTRSKPLRRAGRAEPRGRGASVPNHGYVAAAFPYLLCMERIC